MCCHTAVHDFKNPAGFPSREMSDCKTMRQNCCMTRDHVRLPSILSWRVKHAGCIGHKNVLSGWRLQEVGGVHAGVYGGAYHAHGEAPPSWHQ